MNSAAFRRRQRIQITKSATERTRHYYTAHVVMMVNGENKKHNKILNCNNINILTVKFDF